MADAIRNDLMALPVIPGHVFHPELQERSIIMRETVQRACRKTAPAIRQDSTASNGQPAWHRQEDGSSASRPDPVDSGSSTAATVACKPSVAVKSSDFASS